MPALDLAAVAARRDRLSETHLRPHGEHPASVSRGLRRIATWVQPDQSRAAVDRLEDAGVESEVATHFADSIGARIELIADPMGQTYGDKVLRPWLGR